MLSSYHLSDEFIFNFKLRRKIVLEGQAYKRGGCMNYYLVEYHHDSEGYKYEEFCAEDQFEAVEMAKAIPFCTYIQNVYMQVRQWEKEEV